VIAGKRVKQFAVPPAGALSPAPARAQCRTTRADGRTNHWGKNPRLQVICEVSDGLDAVQKAEELKPDLILLDIGLPTLNGIEAARQIRKLAPDSKIIFLSQEPSVDVVREALSLGAWGYVVKTLAGNDLFAAVESVLLGKRFVSSE
jgi:DNA-binding NarL/FixJ family response regulator